MEKSELILVGRVENLAALAFELGCQIGRLPSIYLDLPLGAPLKLANSVGCGEGENLENVGLEVEMVFVESEEAHSY